MGGHIGYVVVPEFRRQGYATASFACRCRSRVINVVAPQRILVTCDDDNVGSIRTIERNSGMLENVVSGPDLDKPKRRYWIDITTGAA